MLRMKIAKLIPYFRKHMSLNSKKGEIILYLSFISNPEESLIEQQ